MVTVTYTCDCCGDKLAAYGYYETKITLRIESQTNGDCIYNKEKNNKKTEFHLCPKCNEKYWKQLEFLFTTLKWDTETMDKIIKIIQDANTTAK